MKLIVLDRDGVINEARDDVIKETLDFVPIEGSLEAIARLSQNNFNDKLAARVAAALPVEEPQT